MKELTSILKSCFKIERYKLIQQILTTHRFHSCKFVCSLKLICNPQINTCTTFVIICRVFKDMQRSFQERQKIPVSQHISSQPRSNTYSAFLFQFSYCKQMSFLRSTYCHIFSIFVFFLVTLLFRLSPTYVVRILCITSKLKKAVIHLTEKFCLLHKVLMGHELQCC